MKTALLLCASHNDLYLIFSLRKLGYKIIATGKVKGLPGEIFVDRYIQADYSDKELILKIAKTECIDAIVQCCNDYGVYTAAYVAEKLNLPGYDSYETTLILHNKDRFKKFAVKNGIMTVSARFFTDCNEALHWFGCEERQKQGFNFPLIVKPVDCSAGNGIKRLDRIEEVPQALKLAFAKSREGRILIERFLEGTQHGFSSFLKDGKVVAYCTNNEYSFLNPYRVEIDTFPADNSQLVAPFIIRQIEKTAKLLNLCNGMFHLQYIIESGKPYIVEVMRRIAGNMYHVPARMLTDFNWEYWETRSRCGLSLEKIPRETCEEGFFAYKTILAPCDGTIAEIKIHERYNHNLWKKYFLRKPGDKISHHETEPIGYLFLMFSSQEEMKRLLIDDYANDCVTMK